MGDSDHCPICLTPYPPRKPTDEDGMPRCPNWWNCRHSMEGQPPHTFEERKIILIQGFVKELLNAQTPNTWKEDEMTTGSDKEFDPHKSWDEEQPYKSMADHPDYPQTWSSVCDLRKIPEIGEDIYRMVQKICGEHGHEWSKTEWGYGGGNGVDVWCRWCNFQTTIDIDEAIEIWPHIQPLYEQGLTEEAIGDVVAESEVPNA
jgi:hypothetical protein